MTLPDFTARNAALALVASEYYDARKLYPPMRSPHEGYAILLEEVRELEREVVQPGTWRGAP